MCMFSGLVPTRLSTVPVAFSHFTVGSRQQRETKSQSVMFPGCSAGVSSGVLRPVFERHFPERHNQ